jgi:putative SOS response-associated peptidase YedK
MGGEIICGRYTVFTEDEIIEMREIINEISKTFGPQAVKTGEIFPTDIVPVVRLVDGKVVIDRGTWGFPHWEPGKRPVINARSETAASSRMFKNPLMRSRCVVPSTGFYEWTPVEGKTKKDKYLFNRPESRMLYIAGVMERFKDKDGELTDHFAILTQAPTAYMAAYYDRMPVIIGKSEIVHWLRNDDFVQTVFTREGSALFAKKAS